MSVYFMDSFWWVFLPQRNITDESDYSFMSDDKRNMDDSNMDLNGVTLAAIQSIFQHCTELNLLEIKASVFHGNSWTHPQFIAWK